MNKKKIKDKIEWNRYIEKKRCVTSSRRNNRGRGVSQHSLFKLPITNTYASLTRKIRVDSTTPPDSPTQNVIDKTISFYPVACR